MYIRDMCLTEISRKIEPYLLNYFKGCALVDFEDGYLAEGCLLGYNEIKHLLPSGYYRKFDVNEMFYGVSGCLEFNYLSKKFEGSEYTVLLISNKNNTTALFLFVQAEDASTGEQNDILLKDFTKSG